MMSKKAIAVSIISVMCMQSVSSMELTAYVSGFITTNATSLVATATNYLSDDAAFAKLGFPDDNAKNKAELAKFFTVKKRHREEILSNKVTSENFANDLQFLERRRGYCYRLVNAVSTHAEGIKLAFFAVQNYLSVMNEFDKMRLTTFIAMKQKSAQQQSTAISMQMIQVASSSEQQALVAELLVGMSKDENQKKEEPK